MLDNQLLAKLRQVTAQYLKDTCTIEKLAPTFDQYGGQDASQWQTVASNIPCRIITVGNRTGQEGELVGSQESLVETYRVIVPAGTGLAPNQRLTINGVVYQVVQLLTARTDDTDEQVTVTRARIS